MTVPSIDYDGIRDRHDTLIRVLPQEVKGFNPAENMALRLLIRSDVPLLVREAQRLALEIERIRTLAPSEETNPDDYNDKHLIALIRRAKAAVMAPMLYMGETNGGKPERVDWRLKEALTTLDQAEERVRREE